MAAREPARKRPVTVGVDGSEHALDAVAWASAEATRRATRLHLLLVSDDPARAEYAQNAIQAAEKRARAEAPDLDITNEIATAHPVDELVRRSRNADRMVLGSRGRGGFAHRLLGSVSTAVATHGRCPVIVVHGRHHPDGSVVVGLDGSPGSEAALGFAIESAAERGCGLVAVQAWREEGLFPAALPSTDREQVHQSVERSLTEQLAGWNEKYPTVRMHKVALHGHPVAVLTDAAREAGLLVVGHRGRGGFTGLYIGSVAMGVLHHGRCPVAVVR